MSSGMCIPSFRVQCFSDLETDRNIGVKMERTTHFYIHRCVDLMLWLKMVLGQFLASEVVLNHGSDPLVVFPMPTVNTD